MKKNQQTKIISRHHYNELNLTRTSVYNHSIRGRVSTVVAQGVCRVMRVVFLMVIQ